MPVGGGCQRYTCMHAPMCGVGALGGIFCMKKLQIFVVLKPLICFMGGLQLLKPTATERLKTAFPGEGS